MAARLTDRPGSSAYVLGGVTAYSNEAKVAHVGVPATLIERHGAVSPEVGRALAAGAVERFGASLGIGITGIAGPDGGTPDKPVGTVCVCVAGADGSPLIERAVRLPGDRAAVRDRTTTLAHAPAAPGAARGARASRPDRRRLARPLVAGRTSGSSSRSSSRRRRAPLSWRSATRPRTRTSGGRSPTRRSISRSPSSAAARPAT